MSSSTPISIPEPAQELEDHTSDIDINSDNHDDSGTDSDTNPTLADDMVRVSSIPTLGQMYKDGLLKAAAKEKVKRSVDKALLERVSLFRGDIVKLEVDSIVNAANKSLLGGGGVDGAIHAAAGPKLVAECRQLNGCETGQSKITRGYNLPSAHVIHTVGPVYGLPDIETKAAQLASCYKTSLQLAVENSLKHIAFPCISTGIYGYPIEDATHIALKTVRDFIESEEGSKLERVIFVIWTPRDKGVYETLLPEYFPPAEESTSTESAEASTTASAPAE
ncbi:A1pp-domain-containing protein [Ephemerocybe angulata]|uniref:A1pp-domain-containing protein n=1 Tax=Ephemerocybe angulata TaxID=980116 RepID=A0A8H6I478_9AGAR|nr:A1pp-domain-containing protein [Tulosesus angulatus]